MLNGAYAGEEKVYIYIGFNAYWEPHTFALPSLPVGMKWERAMESAPSETEKLHDEAVAAAVARQVEAANDRAVIATARAEHALLEEKNEKEYRAFYLREKEEAMEAEKTENDQENTAEMIERRIAERIMFGRHSASALKKSADEAWEELERVKQIEDAPVFPEDQRYIMVPARSVTILTGVPEV